MGESDAIVIGAGHNGLVCWAYLARAGLRTLVLERRGVLGGACVTEEIRPGYRVLTASYVMSLLQPNTSSTAGCRPIGSSSPGPCPATRTTGARSAASTSAAP